MSTLIEKLNEILDEKTLKVLPENVKTGVTMFGVNGTMPNVNIKSSLSQPYPRKGIWIESDKKFNLAKFKGDQGVLTWDTMNYGIFTPKDYDSGKAAVVGDSVYMFGVETDTPTTSWACYSYNFKTGEMKHEFDETGRLREPGIAVVGTDIYVIGSSMSGSSTRMYKYDTINKSLTRKSDIPYDFYSAGVAYWDGYIYLIGSQESGCRNNFYRYSINNDTYESIGSLPFEFWRACAICIDGIIYMFKFGQKLLKYDIANSELITTDVTVPNLGYVNPMLINGKVYTAYWANYESSGTTYQFDPKTDTFTNLNSHARNLIYCSTDGITVTYNGEIYICGGTKPGDSFGKYIVKGYFKEQTYNPNSLVIDTTGNNYSTELVDNVETTFKKAFVTGTDGLKDSTINVYTGQNNQFIKVEEV